MVFLVLLLALFAPVLSPQDPNYMSLSERFASPSIKHPFGLDENGSDVFAKVAYGARISLGVEGPRRHREAQPLRRSWIFSRSSRRVDRWLYMWLH